MKIKILERETRVFTLEKVIQSVVTNSDLILEDFLLGNAFGPQHFKHIMKVQYPNWTNRRLRESVLRVLVKPKVSISASIVIINTNPLSILLLRRKDQDVCIVPRLYLKTGSIAIEKKERGVAENTLKTIAPIFAKIYDVDLISCCKNGYLFNKKDRDFVYILEPGEWSGTPIQPRSVVYGDIYELVWIDLDRALRDKEYSSSIKLDDYASEIVAEIYRKYYDQVHLAATVEKLRAGDSNYEKIQQS